MSEQVAPGTPAARHAFAEHDVAYLNGDWTRQAPAITNFLCAHGSDGVTL